MSGRRARSLHTLSAPRTLYSPGTNSNVFLSGPVVEIYMLMQLIDEKDVLAARCTPHTHPQHNHPVCRQNLSKLLGCRM